MISFADDCTILISSDDKSDLEELSSRAISYVYSWMKTNGLILNSNKTKYILFGRQASVQVRVHCQSCRNPTSCSCPAVGPVSSHKFLGLRFETHIVKVCSRVRTGLAILARLRTLASVGFKKAVYFSLIDSVIRYMISCYGASPFHLSERILRLQKKAVRLVTNSPYVAHSAPLFQELRAFPFYRLYASNLVTSALPSLGSLLTYEHKYPTRAATTGMIPPTELMKTSSRKSNAPNFLRLYNSLPPDEKLPAKSPCLSP